MWKIPETPVTESNGESSDLNLTQFTQNQQRKRQLETSFQQKKKAPSSSKSIMSKNVFVGILIF